MLTRVRGSRREHVAGPRTRRLALEWLEHRWAPATLLSGFTEAVAASGLSNATAMEFAPDGKLFVTEQAGTMEVWRNGTQLQANFFSNTPLSTQTSSERGLLGVAFDPNYAGNHYVYVYYTTTAADNHNRVSRFTADASGNLALAGSEKVLLELDPHSAGNHNGGAIHFGPDGKLYIGVGDDANQDNPTSTPNAQRLSTLHGKLLRINADGTIPSDNPFLSQTTGKYQAIWALGLRNPFSFAFQPGTGTMFINDVGQSTWEEIDVGAKGANYGWSITEGAFNQGTYPNFTEPLYAYNHSASVTTPSGIAITGGAFYNPAVNQFGADYTGDYFFADYGGGWIYRIDPASKAVTQFATGISAPVDLKVDAAGNLYYLARGSGQVFEVSKPTATAGLAAQFFDFTASLSTLPNLAGRTADVTRTDALINYPATRTVWTGLDSRFADTFALRETGYLKVDTAGTYTLYLNSDDGSKLWLDGKLVIDNNGLHSMRERSATVTLAAGYHQFRTEFFENAGLAGLVVSWSGPGIAKQVIPAASFSQTVPGTAYQQDTSANGLVVMEAENNDGNASQGGKSWTPYTATSGYSDTEALQATPNTGALVNTGYVTASPRLDFRVNFAKTGTYYVWVRGLGATGNDDSVHVGLDGAAVSTADRISSFSTGYTWTDHTMDGPVATINVTTAGLHTVNLRMREDGTVVDKLLLTTNAAYQPSGLGPSQSPRTAAVTATAGVVAADVGSAPAARPAFLADALRNLFSASGVDTTHRDRAADLALESVAQWIRESA